MTSDRDPHETTGLGAQGGDRGRGIPDGGQRSARGSRGLDTRSAFIRDVIPPLVLVLVLAGAWQLAASYGVLADALGLDSFLVPSPAGIAESLWVDRSLLAENASVTLVEILAGFSIALVLGTTTASVLHLSDLLRRAAYPVVVASQTIPIIVIAPVLVLWFGYGIGPKLAVVALICFFPIAVNTLDGLQSVDRDLVRVMRTLDAGRLAIFRRVEVPTALPFAFSGAKIAVAVAVIGAVFGEWVGAERGLGYLILQDNAQLMTARMFAAVVVLSTIAITLFAAVSLLERRLLRWR